MHVLLIVFGLLLLLFGGGCTLITLGYLFGGSANIVQELMDGWWILVFFCFMPLVVGWLLFRQGLRIDRERRKAAAASSEERKP
mgnify:CR=1 FL=1